MISRSRTPTPLALPTDTPDNDAQLQALEAQLLQAQRLRDGAENLLNVFAASDDRGGLRAQVEDELSNANRKIHALADQIDALRHAIDSSPTLALARQRRDFTPLQSISRTPRSSSPPLRTAYSSAKDDSFEFHQHVLHLRNLIASLSPSSTEEAPLTDDAKVANLNAAVDLLYEYDRAKHEISIADIIDHLVPCLSDNCDSLVRAAAYRLIRFVADSDSTTEALRNSGIDIFLIKSLTRPANFDNERIQALLLLRSWLYLPLSAKHLSRGLVRCIVAIAEQSEDRLRNLALVTLTELVIRDVQLLAEGDGLKLVLQALVDGPKDLVPTIALAFLTLIDMPASRSLLRPGMDLEIALSPLTNANPKPTPQQEDRLRLTAEIIGLFLKTWPGLLYLCANDMRAIKSLVEALTTTSDSIRDILITMFFDIFRIENRPWASVFLDGKRLTQYRKTAESKNMQSRQKLESKTSKKTATEDAPARTNLIDQYLGLLLLIFIDAGLLDSLMNVAEDTTNLSSSRKASLLIGELLQIGNRVLPLHYGAHLQSLPRLFSLIWNTADKDARLAATNALRSVDSLSRNFTRLQNVPTTISKPSRDRSNSVDDPLQRGQRHVESTKIILGMQIDDAAFRALILESKVLQDKDWNAWGFQALTTLVEGPFLNPKRLEEATRGSKFMKRVLAFFHPTSRQYSELRKTKHTVKWTKLACTLLSTLLATSEGIRCLAEDKLLRQIADCLVQLDPLSGAAVVDPILSQDRLKENLSAGYFEMLGVLTKHPEGLRLLERFRIFTLLYHLSDVRSREDVIKLIIDNIDYENDGHTRIILSKSLTSSYKHVRLFATKRLGKLLREATSSTDWLVQLLITQLYDPSMEVCKLAVRILQEACMSLETLELVVAMRPSLDHLGDIGAPLLFRFLSTSIGARYLHQIEYIDRQMDDWLYDRNDVYASQLELNLAEALKADGSTVQSGGLQFNGVVPLHFYGELVKTSEGRAILERKGHFTQFVDYIRQFGSEGDDLEVIAKLKSVLWAVGNIGSNEGGIAFLEAENLVQTIVEVAAESPCFSVRGTCFYVLGLIATTAHGIELLQAAGWQAVTTPLGAAVGLAFPNTMEKLVKPLPWTPPQIFEPAVTAFGTPSTHLEREIISAFGNLGNHLLANPASRTLAKISSKHPAIFNSKSLFCRALLYLESAHYRLPVRRYILDLFKISLEPKSVKDIMATAKELKSVGRVKSGKRHTTRMQRPMSIDLDDSSGASSGEEETTAVMPREEGEPAIIVKGFVMKGDG